jgi:hypothetical protein
MNHKAFHAVDGRSLWKSRDYQNTQAWIWHIPEHGAADIDAALTNVERKGLHFSEITKQDFPLPRIEEELAAIAEEVEEGRGFQLIRGLAVHKYDVEQLRKIFWGLGLYWGSPVKQTKQGDWIIDVRNEGDTNPLTRGYNKPILLNYHTDGSNSVGLLCINKALEGGLSLIVSAAAIHNALLETNPEYVECLYKGFPVDRRDLQPDGEPRITPWKLPIFSFTNGRLNCVYDRQSSEWGCERSGHVLSETEKAAFEAFDALSQSPEYHISMELQPGDIQLVNNFTVLHSRTSFVDQPDAEKRRHLLRLWLEVPDSQRYAINKLHLYTRTPVPEGIEIHAVA